MKKKILIIDDEDLIRFLYSDELIRCGYEVITAEGGNKLLETIKSENPNLIILDIKMPDHNGLDLLIDIRKVYPKLPVFICTAYDTFMDDIKSTLADDYIIKSFDLFELKMKIIKILGDNQDKITIKEILSEKLIQLLNNSEKDIKSPLKILERDSNSSFHHKNSHSSKTAISKDEIEMMFNDLKSVFNKELKQIRNYIRNNIDTLDFYGSYTAAGNFNVLSENRFDREVNNVKVIYIKEMAVINKRLVQLVKNIEEKKPIGIPLDVLKAILFWNKKENQEIMNLANLVNSDIRHDLMNLINKIQGKIMMNVSLEERSIDQNDLNHLKNIYSRLSDISSFIIVPFYENIDLNKFIQDIIDNFDQPIEKIKKIKFVYEKSVQIFTEPRLLSIIIRQILRNAIEAIENRGDQGKIEVIVENLLDQNKVVIIIEDNGCGIPSNLIEKVFNKNITYRKDTHSGLGLYLSRIAASYIGAEIIIESEVDKWTKCVVTLPMESKHVKKI